MDKFFLEFETTTMAVFKRFPEDQRERIAELYKIETEAAQKKLEEKALREHEAALKKQEEADAKAAAADPKGKPPPKKEAAKGKGKNETPDLNVEQLQVPEV